MTKNWKFVALATYCLALIGCSTASGIQRADQSKSQFDEAVLYEGETSILREDVPDSEAYRIFHQGASSFTPVSAVRSSAETRARNFCNDKGRKFELLRETRSVGPHILGNFPRAELVFVCVAVAPEGQGEKGNQGPDRYDELKKLKSLLDDGAITQEEYDREKSEILAR